MKDIRIRAVRPYEDVDELLAIYAPYVTETAVSFEYVPPTREEFLQRILNTVKSYPYLVAEVDGRIAGYVYISKFHERPAYDWSVETSIYIDMKLRKSGIGTKLYEEVEKILKERNYKNMYACIAYPNPASIAFHEKMGYKTIGHFTNCAYKLDKWYDMVWMEKFIGEHKDIPDKIIGVNMIE